METEKLQVVEIEHDAWIAEAISRFGQDPLAWRFKCPSCGHVASVKDWRAAGADEGEIAFSCVGRHLSNPSDICKPPGPCNYAGGGLFRFNPVHVRLGDGTIRETFAFADSPLKNTSGESDVGV